MIRRCAGSLAVVVMMLMVGPGMSWADDTIKAIQMGLTTMGYDPGPIDGVVGNNTRRAIKSYQAEFQLDQDGEPSATLLAHINKNKQTAVSAERILAREGLLRSYTRAVQEGLRDLGYDSGPIDALVGPLTRRAIRAWQTDNGLEDSGEVTTHLLAGINEARGI